MPLKVELGRCHTGGNENVPRHNIDEFLMRSVRDVGGVLNDACFAFRNIGPPKAVSETYADSDAANTHADVVETDGSIDVESQVVCVGKLFEVRRSFALVWSNVGKHAAMTGKIRTISVELTRTSDSKYVEASVLLVGAKLTARALLGDVLGASQIAKRKLVSPAAFMGTGRVLGAVCLRVAVAPELVGADLKAAVGLRTRLAKVIHSSVGER